MTIPKNFKQIVTDVVDEALVAKMPYIKKVIENTIDEKIPEILREEIKYLPTKTEFFKRMDELLGEVKAMREEFAVTTHRSKTYDERLEKLEKIHPKNSHSFTQA